MAKAKGTQEEAGKIARAVGVLSSTTALSRILGLVRDMATAALFGAGGALDAFFVAFRLPNILRSLLAEGSLTVSFVPIYVETLEKEGEERANRLGRIAFTLLGVAVVLIAAAGVAFAPELVKLTAMGFTRDPEKFALTVTLTRIVFPYIAFVALTALAGGMLNARGHFFFPAFAPVVLNVCIIAAAFGLSPLLGIPVSSLAYGVLAGGLLHFLMQFWPLSRHGFRYRPDFHWKDPAVSRILLLMGPSIFGVAVYQFNILISTFLASWLPEGAVSYLYYAERLFQLPLGVFAVSVGMASLTSLSRLSAREDWEGFYETVGGSARLLWFIVIPATVGLFLVADPLVALLFERGRFTAAMTDGTARALRWYALALVPVATSRVVVQGFYALKDTKTPVKAAFFALLVNLAACLALMGPMEHAGLALATAISSACNLAYLVIAFHKKTGHRPFEGQGEGILRMGAAAAVMGATVGLLLLFLAPYAREGGTMLRALVVCLLVGAGVAAYAVAAHLLGLQETRTVLRRVLRKR